MAKSLTQKRYENDITAKRKIRNKLEDILDIAFYKKCPCGKCPYPARVNMLLEVRWPEIMAEIADIYPGSVNDKPPCYSFGVERDNAAHR